MNEYNNSTIIGYNDQSKSFNGNKNIASSISLSNFGEPNRNSIAVTYTSNSTNSNQFENKGEYHSQSVSTRSSPSDSKNVTTCQFSKDTKSFTTNETSPSTKIPYATKQSPEMDPQLIKTEERSNTFEEFQATFDTGDGIKTNQQDSTQNNSGNTGKSEDADPAVVLETLKVYNMNITS